MKLCAYIDVKISWLSLSKYWQHGNMAAEQTDDWNPKPKHLTRDNPHMGNGELGI
jgi:hypothetical protein